MNIIEIVNDFAENLIEFSESMFKEMFELLLSLMIKVKPEQAAELQKILNKLKG